MSDIPRRDFLFRAGAYAGTAAIAPSLAGLLACNGSSGRPTSARAVGYGPLTPRGPELALPDGFEYAVLSVEGQPMSDGSPTPRAHDGMGLFPVSEDVVRLVRNHEIQTSASEPEPLVAADLAYDPLGGGGTTTLELRLPADAGPPELVRDFVSLGGTIINCAGGITPWRSWLTCEETNQGTTRGWSVPHGYIFEVSADADRAEPARPLRDMGRFTHEAVAVDPATGIVYETEDWNRRAGFYRFRPDTPRVLADGGTLEMLAVVGRPQVDLRIGQQPGVWMDVAWVEIPDPDPDSADRNVSAVFEQGYEAGGARFSRLEGCFYADESIYFTATDGGDAQLGQVWRYVPATESLTLVFESPSEDVLSHPDNLAISPRGGLLICEDNEGVSHLHGMTPTGDIFPFAANVLNEREFAGACFSPDGRYLFVNIQGDLIPRGPGNLGYTLAIWGPWEDGEL
ncbi:MAG: PhoX family protein [Gemmatimonadetes bacterium]|nr:PhoX family protein [Gemmatimonadota bacterium]